MKSQLISTLKPFPFLITSWACSSGNLEGSSLPSTLEGRTPRLVPRYLLLKLRSRTKMVTCLMVGKQHSHCHCLRILLASHCLCQYGCLRTEEPWFSGPMDYFILTMSITEGSVNGKLCSHSATLMIHVPTHPLWKGTESQDLILLLLHVLSHRATEPLRSLSEPLSVNRVKGSKGSGMDSFLSCFPNTPWLQKSLEEKN